MKNIFLSFFILFSLNIYSQDTIYLKDGRKIIPEPGVNKYYGTPLTRVEDGKRINYFLVNSSWGRSVKSKDLDYASVGGRLLKSLETKYYKKGELKTDKPMIFEVLIETEKYRLVTFTFYGKLIVPLVRTFLIDRDNIIVESASYFAGNTKNDDINRNNVVEMIKRYFSHIKEEMEFLEYCKSVNKNEKSGIQAFLDNHLYKKYI